MNKLDKKQVPQFAALCVLSAGVFGYFVLKIVTPSPAAAGTRPHPAPAVAQAAPAASPATAKATATATAAAPAVDGADAPAPTPGMRDPFVVGSVDSGAAASATPAAAPAAKPFALPRPAKAAPQVASIREVSPAPVGAPALPFGLRSLPPMGAAPGLPTAPEKAAPRQEAPPAAPAWTVTGVLQSAGGQVAVLRSGEARRIVRNGDAVDGVYRVVAVTRSAVVLRHGKTFYHLALGAGQGAEKARVPAYARPAVMSAPAFTPAPVPTATAQAPDDTRVGPAQVVEAALTMARSYMTPAQAQVDACLASLRAPSQETAQAALDLSRDLYGDGRAEGGGARWQCALAANDPDAAHGAVKMTDFTL